MGVMVAGVDFLVRWVDPGGGGQCRRLRGSALEADGVIGERCLKRDGALLGHRRSGAIVDSAGAIRPIDGLELAGGRFSGPLL